MISRKINRLISSILGVALIIGIMEVPALAVDSVQATENINFTESKNCIVNKDNSIEKNGLKISIDKVTGTKHKLKTVVKIENQKPFDKTNGINVISELTYGENQYRSEGKSDRYPDEKTLEITFERESEEELPEKGELRVDIVIPSYKVNVGLDATVDFAETFKNVIEKDLNLKMKDANFTLNQVEFSDLGTKITCTGPAEDIFDREKSPARQNSPIILKIGDKMYKARFSGSYSEDDKLETMTYEAETVNYQSAKAQNNISIVPIISDMTWGELEKIYREEIKNQNNKGKNQNEETINNVTYVKAFEFSNGNKGEIYNIERNDNTIKIYCKGTTEKESLLLASNININYHFEEGKDYIIDYYDGDKYMSFYKDPKETLGYIVEFNNVKKDKAVDLNYDTTIKQIDKYKVEDEIQISK